MMNMPARSRQALTDSEVLADRMPSEKIEIYLQIAHATVSKSVLAILMGTLIVAFGVFFPQLLNWAIAPSNAQASSILWVIQGFYVVIGAYLTMQGVFCFLAARVQSTVMSKALQLKRVFAKKG